eukprot:TRINITY_DN72598_c0_g1_i1.p2 TRINITY_DN72598_c0_g1~~TRINITY_DN72598_c0_g1_i1.p2  ORF type:complete len:535 (+),score=97.59 TRINITY_DN72598_c0_g1_i1:121-1605(+)
MAMATATPRRRRLWTTESRAAARSGCLALATTPARRARRVAWQLALLLAAAAARGASAASNASDAGPVHTPAEITSSEGAPRLLYLGVRSGDRAAQLSPDFQPGHYIYSATLDFYSGGFSLDAVPASGVTIIDANGLEATRVVPPGTERKVEVRVLEGTTEPAPSMTYSLTVSRRSGQEIQLSDVTVFGATVSPVFSPDLTDYFVHMPPEMDVVDFRIALLDVGQALQAVAGPEGEALPTGDTPASAGSAAGASSSPAAAPSGGVDPLQPQLPVVSGSGGSSRRLQVLEMTTSTPLPNSGETQRAVVHRRFPIGVGKSRAIELRVRAANGDPAFNQTYRFKASRAPCPDFRPLFAPDVGVCAVTCNEGFFADMAAKRCEACAEHCLRCTSWDGCQRCEPSDLRKLYFVYEDAGHCQRFQIPWMQIALGVALLSTLLSICVCGLTACWPARRRGRPVVRRKRHGRYEEDGVESHRLLGADDAENGAEDSDASEVE